MEDVLTWLKKKETNVLISKEIMHFSQKITVEVGLKKTTISLQFKLIPYS